MTRNVKNFIKGGLVASFGTFGFFIAVWLILDLLKAIGIFSIPVVAFVVLFIAGGFVYMTYWNKS